MVIIDTHIHFSRIASFEEAALKESGCNYSLSGLKKELAHNKVQAAIAICAPSQAIDVLSRRSASSN